MENILEKNNDDSIDVLDDYGYSMYRISKGENSIIARLANQLGKYEQFFSKDLKNVLMEYFDINNDTYTYNLTRDKSAFSVGTMKFEDFEEFTEEIIDDIVEYIKKKF